MPVRFLLPTGGQHTCGPGGGQQSIPVLRCSLWRLAADAARAPAARAGTEQRIAGVAGATQRPSGCKSCRVMAGARYRLLLGQHAPVDTAGGLLGGQGPAAQALEDGLALHAARRVRQNGKPLRRDRTAAVGTRALARSGWLRRARSRLRPRVRGSSRRIRRAHGGGNRVSVAPVLRSRLLRRHRDRRGPGRRRRCRPRDSGRLSGWLRASRPAQWRCRPLSTLRPRRRWLG
jgi:hypothetical protein